MAFRTFGRAATQSSGSLGLIRMDGDCPGTHGPR